MDSARGHYRCTMTSSVDIPEKRVRESGSKLKESSTSKKQLSVHESGNKHSKSKHDRCLMSGSGSVNRHKRHLSSEKRSK
mmetsp:Transcript_24250/g.18445  ORF Transcript_24250/g.18445 Transcript_24250/m.18445 type:complete len:80 (+) Transcript_24250:630-869(+)